MARLGNTKVWVPGELFEMPFLLGMSLFILFDALTPFLSDSLGASGLDPVSCAEFARTPLFLVVALAAGKARSLFHSPAFLASVCIAASAGVALIVLARFVAHPLVASLVIAVGSVGVGAFWCFALLKFSELFTGVSLGCTVATFVFCHFLGSAVASAVVFAQARALAVGLLAAIPLVLLVWGRRFRGKLCAPANALPDAESGRLRIPVRPYALMLVTLFVAAIVRSHIPVDLEPATYLGAFLCAAALTVVMEVKRRSVHPRMLYYLTLFLLMVGLLLFTESGEVALVAAGGSVNAGYLCFSVLIMALLCNVCRRYAINSYWMFGLLGFIERISYDAGSAAGGLLALQPATVRYTVAFACAIVVAIAFVTLLTERDYRTSWGTMKDEAQANPVAAYYQTLGDCCSAVSEQYGLTRREEEVLLLLAQRKTLPDIERELYVSNSTARTHCKNIYKKLGVHKREELLVMMGHPSVGERAE